MKQLESLDFSSSSQYPWLQNIGSEFDCGDSFVSISDRSEAVHLAKGAAYQDFQETAQGDLTEFLFSNYPNEYQHWNTSIRHIKNELESQFEKINKTVSDLRLPKCVSDSVRWDLMHAYQERAFGRLPIPVHFSNLMPVYEAGHFVCGLVDGRVAVH